jgi:hypothetical protein
LTTKSFTRANCWWLICLMVHNVGCNRAQWLLARMRTDRGCGSQSKLYQGSPLGSNLWNI